MEANETVKAYITRARNIASRSASLGKIISIREMVMSSRAYQAG